LDHRPAGRSDIVEESSQRKAGFTGYGRPEPGLYLVFVELWSFEPGNMVGSVSDNKAAVLRSVGLIERRRVASLLINPRSPPRETVHAT
jgi:hypothetical protein